MCLIVGPKNAGKASLVRIMAYLGGRVLTVLSLNCGTDVGDLLGGFEQLEWKRKIEVRKKTFFRASVSAAINVNVFVRTRKVKACVSRIVRGSAGLYF